MAVQFADKALDEWLTRSISHMYKHGIANDFDKGYLQALEETKLSLHTLWGSALRE